MSRTIPIVLFGRSEEVAKMVKEALKPECEIIHFFNEEAQGHKDLPLLLSSKTPSAASAAGIGSDDYSRTPEAILFGKGFAKDVVDRLHETCSTRNDLKTVPWFSGGLHESEVKKLLNGENPPPPPAEYAPVVGRKVKDAMAKVKSEGKWNEDGDYRW